MPGAPAPTASADRVTRKSAPYRVLRAAPGEVAVCAGARGGQVVGGGLSYKGKASGRWWVRRLAEALADGGMTPSSLRSLGVSDNIAPHGAPLPGLDARVGSDQCLVLWQGSGGRGEAGR